jgi:hypothetical protein
MNNNRKEFKSAINKKRKERHKIVGGSKSICRYCGYIGMPHKQQQGTWWWAIYRLFVWIAMIVLFPVSLLLDGIMVILRISTHKDSLFRKNFGRFVMAMPFNLYGCKACGVRNSMVKLNSQDGRMLYDNFARDRFINTREIEN